MHSGVNYQQEKKNNEEKCFKWKIIVFKGSAYMIFDVRI